MCTSTCACSNGNDYGSFLNRNGSSIDFILIGKKTVLSAVLKLVSKEISNI
jgi:hypothetical protein